MAQPIFTLLTKLAELSSHTLCSSDGVDGPFTASRWFGGCGGLGQQDRAHRLGGDATGGELPASGRGGITAELQAGACERATKRDGTVGRSDAIESSLAVHRDSDPVRMMRPRCAEPIRASSPPGLHQPAGHMTANDPCATRHMTSCRAGGREMTCCPSTLALATLRITTLA